MTDAEIQELVATSEEWSGKPFTTAPELAEKIGMSRQGVHSRLQTLVEEGRIEKYRPGQSAVYWSRSTPSQDSALQQG